MIKKVLFAGFALVLGYFGSIYAETGGIIDLSEGIVNSVDSSRIPDNAVSEAQNVYFDKDTMVEKRKGMLKLNINSIGSNQEIYKLFEYIKSNGIHYQIAGSSTTLYYRTSGADFITLKTNYSNMKDVHFAVFIDTLCVANGNDNLFGFDPITQSTWTYITTNQPKYILTWNNRLWLAGDLNEVSSLRSTEYLNAHNITIPSPVNSLATDPVLFDINSQDGQKITGLFLSPNGNLGILKENSFYELSGNDRDDFSIRLISTDVGCIDSGSIIYRNNFVYWITGKYIIVYDGNSLKKISDNIKNTIDSIQQLNINTNSFVKDTKEQWYERDWVNRFYLIDINETPGIIYRQNPVNPLGYTQLNDYWSTVCVDTNTNIIYSGYGNNAGYGLSVSKMNNKEPTSYLDSTAYYNQVVIIDTNCRPFGNQHMAIGTDNIIQIVYPKYNTGTSDWDIWYASCSAVNIDIGQWKYKKISSSIGNIETADWRQYNAITCSISLDSDNHPHILFCGWLEGDHCSTLHYMYKNPNWGTELVFNTNSFSPDGENYILGNGRIVVRSVGDIIGIITNKNIVSPYLTQISNIAFNQNTDDPNLLIYALSAVATTDEYTRFRSCSIDLDSDGTWWNLWQDYSSNIYLKEALSGTAVKVNSTSDFIYQGIQIAVDSNDRVCIEYNSIYKGYFTVYQGGANFKTYQFTGTNYSPSGYTGGALTFNQDMPIIHLLQEVNAPINFGYIWTSSATYASQVYDMGTNDYAFDLFISVQQINDDNITHYLRSDTLETAVSTQPWTITSNNSVPTIDTDRYLQYKCIFSTNVITNNLSTISSVFINYTSPVKNTYFSSLEYDDRLWFGVSSNVTNYLDKFLIYDTNNKWTIFASTIGCRSLGTFYGKPYLGNNTGNLYQLDQGNSDDGIPIESYFKTKTYYMNNPLIQKTFDNFYVETPSQGNWNLNLDYYLDRSGTSSATNAIDLDETENYINKKIPISEQIPFYTFQFKVSNNNADEFWQLLGLYYDYRSISQRP